MVLSQVGGHVQHCTYLAMNHWLGTAHNIFHMSRWCLQSIGEDTVPGQLGQTLHCGPEMCPYWFSSLYFVSSIRPPGEGLERPRLAGKT